VRMSKMAIAAAAVVTLTALVPGTAHADTTTATATLTDGGVSLTLTPFAFGSSALTGANRTISATPAAWTAVNARGTDAAWTITVSSTALTSAAGNTSPENTARTIAVGQMSMSIAGLTAGTGSDDTSHLTSSSVGTMSGSAQTFLSSSSAGSKGTYTFTPTLDVAIPANAYRSNYTTGTTNAGGINAYTATLTVTMS
jgi:hypothetical protein